MRAGSFAFLAAALVAILAGCSGGGLGGGGAWLTTAGTEESFGPYRFAPPPGFESKQTPNVPPGITSRMWLGPKNPPSQPAVTVSYTAHNLDLTQEEPDWQGAISGTFGPFTRLCNSHSTTPGRRLRINELEAIRATFTGQLKDRSQMQAVLYILVDNENAISLLGIDAGPEAARSLERLDESLLTFQRPGYTAPPSIATISRQPNERRSLSEARQGFATELMPSEFDTEPLPEPPAQLFRKVQYESPVGKLGAYLTPDPGDGEKHPAMIWITGGDCNSLGDVWSKQPADNDQSASAYRESGIVMMFPSLRGGNENPGKREGFFGEVDDVLAAANYLAKQSYVDPDRIYLGGHSSGGTLVLLVAECSDRFRAVFSFGPTDDIAGYGREYLPFDFTSSRELELRAPIIWLHWIKTPSFVFEGTGGNLESFEAMEDISKNDRVSFFTIDGEDHFSILAPVNQLIATKILQDDGPACNLSLMKAELARQFESPHRGSLGGPPSFPRPGASAGPPSVPGPGSSPGPEAFSGPGSHSPPGSLPERHLPAQVPPEVRSQVGQFERSRATRAIRENPSHADYFKENLAAIRSDTFDRDKALDRMVRAEPTDVTDEDLRAQIARTMRDLAFDSSAGVHTRKKAIAGLVTWGSTYSVPLLLKLLDDESPFVQKDIVAALGELGDERSIEPLVKLYAADTFGRDDIAEILEKFGPQAEDAVLEHALTDNPIKARRTIELLSHIGTAKSLRFFSQLQKNRRAAMILGNDIQAATLAIQQRAKETKRSGR